MVRSPRSPRSPRLSARLLLAASPLLLVLGAACGNSPACDTTCGTGGTSTTGTGGTGGTGGQLSPTFPCKAATCMRDADVCTVTSTVDATGMHISGACSSLPLDCLKAGADCSCFVDLMGCTCQQQPTGEFDLFCSG
jgi:hypothetical protein